MTRPPTPSRRTSSSARIFARSSRCSVRPRSRATPSLPGVEAAYPVFRGTASAGPASSVSGVTVLGVPGAAIRAMPLWRSDWGTSLDGLADAVAPSGPTALRGLQLAGPRLRLAVGPGLVSYRATVRQPDGSFRVVELGRADGRRPTVLAAELPAQARGGSLVSLTLVPPRIVERGSDEGLALRGSTTIRLLGASLGDWVGGGGVTVVARPSKPGAVRVDYTLTPQRNGVVRARQPTDDAPPAAAVTPALARLVGGVGRVLPLRIGGDPVDVRVAAVVDRIPGTEGDALLADLGAVSTAIDTVAPGTAQASELWLDVAEATGRRRLDGAGAPAVRGPREGLARGARGGRAARPARPRNASRTRRGGAGGARPGGGGAGARDSRRPPRRPRGADRPRGAGGETGRPAPRRDACARPSSARSGVAVGALAGVALALLVTRVVSVTARAAAPQPPLATTVDPLTLALGAAAFTAAAVAVVVLTTRRAFADPRGPGRIGGEG